MTAERYERAGAILSEAVLKPSKERSAFVAKACGEDVALRAEVESLLEHHHTRDLPAPAAPPPRARRPWSAPARIVAAGLAVLALLALAAAWTIGGLEAELRTSAARELQAILDFRVDALRGWAERQKERLKAVAGMPDVVRHVRELVRIRSTSADAKEELLRSPSQAFLRDFCARLPRDLAGRGHVVLDPAGRILSHQLDELIGGEGAALAGSYIRRVQLGEIVLSRPYQDKQYLVGEPAGYPEPLLFVGGTVLGEDGKIVAIIALRFEAGEGFTPLLRSTAPTDVLVFDEKGALLVEPRDRPAAAAAALRDPGGDLTSGFRPSTPVESWPLTRMGSTALAGKAGTDASGYRGFRGRDVLGAWTWLPDWELGIGVERDLAATLGPAGRPRTALAVLGALLSIFVLGGTWASARFELRRRRRSDAFASYVLERRIAKGGMAEIHLAHHTFLKRPTAVKILEGLGADGRAVARFEREARLVSRLSHPNTIQVFDFGRTPDGRFYLAMEYLDGLNVAQLVALAGPLPPARAIHLLLQVCGSLEEAHEAGLVHRDIKPTNLMVARRGGLPDAVKVLDFGIARSIKEETTSLTQPLQVSGTPLYIAPERIRDPRITDPRSDLYSLGATAFLMLTGRNVFEGPGPAEILYQVMSVDPPSPSTLRAEPLPPELDRLVLACLSKDPEKRPAGAAALGRALRALATPDTWDTEDAKAWWTRNEARVARLLEAAAPPKA